MTHATVLALEVIAHRDVDARELDGALSPYDGTKQPDHGRHLDRDADRPNVLVILFDDLDFAVENHAYGALPADDPVGLIALIQDKGTHSARAFVYREHAQM